MPDRLPALPALPPDAICLHIGVHKTGTTALQEAFARSRSSMAQLGVLYPGRRTAHHGPAMAVLDRSWGWRDNGGQATSPAVFQSMARTARRHRGRVLISSEQFCEAGDTAAAAVVAALGADRTHVVLGLRSLASLLPSSWQQYLKYGQTMAYQKWLRTILDPQYDGRVTPTFWRRNDHAALVRRWSASVGPDHVVVLVVEDVPPTASFQAFAELLGLPPNVLQADIGRAANRSMTALESEFLRQLNRSLGKSLGWADYEELVRGRIAAGVLQSRRPGPDEPRLHTPQWALDAASARGEQTVVALRDTGVRVVGDPAVLALRREAGPALPQQALAAVPMADLVAVVADQVRGEAGGRHPNRAAALARRLRWQVVGRVPR